MEHLIIILLLSSLVSYFFINLFIWIFNKCGILDNPKKYGKKRDPIPYSMWIVFFISFFILSYFFVDYNYKLWLIWFFGALVTLISFVDDRLNVSSHIRLVIQIIIGMIIGLTSIKIWYVSNIFWWIINLETYAIELFNFKIYLVPLFFTIIWYVFIFNALNWTDGLEWNTSWISIISFFILFLLGLLLFFRDNYSWWIENAKFIMSISLILVGILIPFWYFDIKEKLLMWDSWTMFLWFMLATLAIIAGWKIATVLVVFWIYSVDAVYVILRRIFNKKSIMKWDFTHLHHRLWSIGLEKKQILLLIYSLSFLFWLTALFLDKAWKMVVFLIIVVVVVFMNKIVEMIYKKKR